MKNILKMLMIFTLGLVSFLGAKAYSVKALDLDNELGSFALSTTLDYWGHSYNVSTALMSSDANNDLVLIHIDQDLIGEIGWNLRVAYTKYLPSPIDSYVVIEDYEIVYNLRTITTEWVFIDFSNADYSLDRVRLYYYNDSRDVTSAEVTDNDTNTLVFTGDSALTLFDLVDSTYETAYELGVNEGYNSGYADGSAMGYIVGKNDYFTDDNFDGYDDTSYNQGMSDYFTDVFDGTIIGAVSGTDGYDDNSYSVGYNDGYADINSGGGFSSTDVDNAYQVGYNDGVASELDLGVFQSMLNFMSGIFLMPILGPDITLGMIIAIPVGFALLKWLFTIFGKGK